MVYKMNPEYDESFDETRLALQRLVTRRCREHMVEFTPVVVSGRGEIATVQLSWDMFIQLLIQGEYLA